MNLANFDENPKPRAQVLRDLSEEGISESIIEEVDSLARLRASRETLRHGLQQGELVEDRETGQLYTVESRSDDQVVLSDGENFVTRPISDVHSPFTYAEHAADLAKEAIRVNTLARKAADDIKNIPGDALR